MTPRSIGGLRSVIAAIVLLPILAGAAEGRVEGAGDGRAVGEQARSPASEVEGRGVLTALRWLSILGSVASILALLGLPPLIRRFRRSRARGETTEIDAIPPGRPGGAAATPSLRLDFRHHLGEDPLAWLQWQHRLVPQPIGRERELKELLTWAREKAPPVRARLVSGEGGEGKTRLAAEVAQVLRSEGWAAGFASLDGSFELAPPDRPTFVILDYPEEHREEVRRILGRLPGLQPRSRLRVLLLSRYGSDLWQAEIDRCGATGSFDRLPMVLPPLGDDDLAELFRIARKNVPRRDGAPALRPIADPEILGWLRRDSLHRRPLFVTAAAVATALEPAWRPVDLSGADAVCALARREKARLEREGDDSGIGEHGLSRLVALAAIAGGLGRDLLDRLADQGKRLGLGFVAPMTVLDALQRRGRLVTGRLPAPSPDIVAAALLVEVLKEGLAAEAIWVVLERDLPGGLARFARLAYDAEVTLGLLDHRPSRWLWEIFEGHPERCRAAISTFSQPMLPMVLAKTASLVWRAALEGVEDPARRAKLLNNLSIDLAADGDLQGALAAIQEAVEIYGRLALADPGQFEPNLATSLNNLSNYLSDARQPKDALLAIEQAVEIYRRLALADPGRFEPDLAMSLNNFALRLSDVGKQNDALLAIQQAVEIYRRLALTNPARFEPDLTLSLNNLSNRLSDAGKPTDALLAIQEAVEIWRRLALADPARFEPDLAMGLNNLSARLSDTGKPTDALVAIQQAVEIYRRLALANAARFEPDLAMSLNNLSNLLRYSGDRAGALAALRSAIERISSHAEEYPDGPHARWLVIMLRNLEALRADTPQPPDEAATD